MFQNVKVFQQAYLAKSTWHNEIHILVQVSDTYIR